MSTALQFTSVFDPTKPPQKLKAGGVGMDTTPIAASKALEARGIKTEAIKDLETPPPVSVTDTETKTLPSPRFMEKFEGLNEQQKIELDEFFNKLQELENQERKELERDLRDDVLRDNLQEMYNQQFGERLQAKAMSPDMNMIMNAQNNMGGIMSTPMKQETGLAALANMTYGDRGKIPV